MKQEYFCYEELKEQLYLYNRAKINCSIAFDYIANIDYAIEEAQPISRKSNRGVCTESERRCSMSQKKIKIVYMFLDGSMEEPLENVSVPVCKIEEILKIINKEKVEELEKLEYMQSI